jgi:hypothetical protein
MIGGSDIVLWVDENAPAAEVILRVFRQHWPDFAFQNADDDQPLAPSASGHPQPSGREFFVYRTLAAAQEWLQSGATEANKNTMIHVIVGNRRKADSGLRSVTLVGDDWTGELAAILMGIQAGFDGFANKFSLNEKTAPVGPMQHVVERE